MAKDPTDKKTGTLALSQFVTAYGPKNKVKLFCPLDENMTKQSFREECDINTIMGRYMRTGHLPLNERQAAYLDVEAMEYRDALDIVIGARDAFSSMTSEVRTRFRNDPAELLAFVNDERNREEAVRLGILKAPEDVTAPGGTQVPGAAAAAASGAPGASATPPKGGV